MIKKKRLPEIPKQPPPAGPHPAGLTESRRSTPVAKKKQLSDILTNSERENLERAWQTTKPADDLKPIPPGDYRCRIVRGELCNSKSGTPGYKIVLEVLDGEHAGRLVWHDFWLTEAALPIARRDLGKLGIERAEQLEQPLPEGIIVMAKVVIHRRDDGAESNVVRRFDVVAVEPPAPDPYAFDEEDLDDGEISDTTDGDGFDWQAGEQRERGPNP
jgi:hypothetical protein